jgi:hypothetical protein
MIEPTSTDVGRSVRYETGSGPVIGKVTGFNAHYVYVAVGSITAPALRRELVWAEEGESPRAKAARSRFEAEGYAVETVDLFHWRIQGHSFWPEIGMWQPPGGQIGGGGVAALLQRLKGGGVS